MHVKQNYFTYVQRICMDIYSNLRYTRLFEIYGQLLTDKQQTICQMYFFDNLTLAEIGENLAVSRQAINDCIEKSTRNLEQFEEKIGKLKLQEYITKELNYLDKKYTNSNLTKDITNILNTLD